MKNVFTCLGFLLLLALNSGLAGEENLVLNPSFEQGAAEGVPAEDWVIREEGIPVERKSEGGHTGEAFMRFDDESPKDGQFLESRRLPARPGGKYTASAWLRTTDACRPGVYLNFYDLNGVRIAHKYERTKAAAKDWQEVQVVDSAPKNVWEVALGIYSYSGDVGVFDADDADLQVEGGSEP